jgi:hypothetical protein
MNMNDEKRLDLLDSFCRHSSNTNYLDKLYCAITESSCYDHSSKFELKLWLHEEFIKYYNIIINDEVDQRYINRGDNRNTLWLINLVKLQLDKELRKVEDK